MVQNSRKTLCTDTIKLNTPERVQVQEDSSGLPVAVKTSSRQLVRLRQIEDKWRIDDEWWRSDPIARLYYAVFLASGQRLVLYKDLVADCWYKQK